MNANKAKSIFLHAVEQLAADQWLDYLSEACGDDSELRQSVEALLAAHRESDDLAEEARQACAEALPTVDHSTTGKPGTLIGPYKLLEEIGEGGMGTVWVAQQTKPVQRKVAIKLIKPGMDSRQVLARFEAERQALAMMDHPNIARVIDGGMTDQGRPYFAMEYVKGVPLIEYCDNARLSVKERLELFIPICKAVQHAHQKGVIHRDLKPSNILVCLYDGKPVPKVIDFGLAKAMHQSLTEKTLYTAHGMMIGTPLYMSPEQAESNNLDVDTRTDIYSLGVILYELLTGSTPLEKAQLKDAAVNEILRLIKEVEPPKPSTRVSASQPNVAAQRSIEPVQLTRSVSGDLDWVVMKALEKERSRRYETANGLAEDIRRHLSDEPVSASPPSASYRLTKLIKRNKRLCIAAAAVFAALTLGLIGTSWGLVVAANARNTAVAEAKRAERELARATEVRQLIDDMFSSITPEEAGGEDITLLKNVLDNAAERLSSGQIEDDVVAADMHGLIGFIYLGLGLPRNAEHHYKSAIDLNTPILGNNHLDVQLDVHNLAIAIGKQGRYAEAEHLLSPLIADLEDAETHREKRVRFAVMNDLGANLRRQHRWEEAKDILGRAIELQRDEYGDDSIFVVPPMSNLGNVYLELKDFESAEAICRQAMNVVDSLPEDAYNRSDCTTPPGRAKEVLTSQLGFLHLNQGRFEEAEPFFEEVLAQCEEKYGERHRTTQVAMTQLANLYYKMERNDDARVLYERSLTLSRRYLGMSDPTTGDAMWGLARTYRKLDMPEEFSKLATELVGLLTSDPPTITSPSTGHLNKYAWVLVRPQPESTRKVSAELALALAQKSCELAESQGGANPGSSLETRARVYVAMGQWERAIADYDRALEIQPELLQKISDYRVRALAALGQWEKAAEVYESAPENDQHPDVTLVWLKVASLRARDGDQAAYSKFCERMVKRFADTEDASIADKVCKACLLKPDSIDVAELPHGVLAISLDDGTAPDWLLPWGWGTRGLLAYRSGNAELAIEHAKKSDECGPAALAHAFNLAVVAMAQHQLGDGESAERALDELSQIVDGENDRVNDFHDLLIAQILLKEVEAKMKKD